jgi:hypothetical protein
MTSGAPLGLSVTCQVTPIPNEVTGVFTTATLPFTARHVTAP